MRFHDPCGDNLAALSLLKTSAKSWHGSGILTISLTSELLCREAQTIVKTISSLNGNLPFLPGNGEVVRCGELSAILKRNSAYDYFPFCRR